MYNKRQIGKEYEEKAASFLIEQGYLIVDVNYYCPFGEIDIIAKADGYLVFAEVKYRKNNRMGDGLEAIDQKKRRRICKSAAYYNMEKHTPDDTPIRFDVIVISSDTPLVYRDAFEYEGYMY